MSQPGSPRSRWRMRGAYALFMLAVLGAGLLGAGAYLATRIREAIGTQAEVTGTWLLDRDSRDHIVLAAHGSTRLRSATYGLDFAVYTDSRGLRVAAAGAETPARVDLLVVGESFFFGWGVNHADTLGAVLETHTGLRVANAAVPAAGTLGALRGVERNADLQPRWVAYGVIDSHLNRNTCPCVPGAMTPLCMAQEYVALDADAKPYTHAPLVSIWAPPEGTRRAFESIVRDRDPLAGAYWAIRMAFGALYRQAFHPCRPDPEPQLAAMNYALGELAAATRAIGAELIVMYIPDLDEDAHASGSPALRALLAARRTEFTLLDLTEDVLAHYRDLPEDRVLENLRFPLDYHPTAAGHRLMARKLCLALPTGRDCDWPINAGP